MLKLNKEKLTWPNFKNFLICLLLFFLPWQARLVLYQGLINHQPTNYLAVSFYATDVLILLLLFFDWLFAPHAPHFILSEL